LTGGRRVCCTVPTPTTPDFTLAMVSGNPSAAAGNQEAADRVNAKTWDDEINFIQTPLLIRINQSVKFNDMAFASQRL
jgi:hypothetical protein